MYISILLATSLYMLQLYILSMLQRMSCTDYQVFVLCITTS